MSYVVPVKSKAKISQNLWPSQNIWTLLLRPKVFDEKFGFENRFRPAILLCGCGLHLHLSLDLRHLKAIKIRKNVKRSSGGVEYSGGRSWTNSYISTVRIVIIIFYNFALTANIFETGAMPTPWKFLDRAPLLPSWKLG